MNEWIQNNQANREATVITPEHVQLRFQTAGLGSRAAAQLIDTAILLLVNITLFIVFSIVVYGSDEQAWSDLEDFAIAILLFVLFLINAGYFFILEAFWSGQTLGKRWMKLRVIRENGQPITFLSAAIRNLFRIIDVLPSGYFLGALVSFFHPKDKRIGDLVAGTIVVAEGGQNVPPSRKQKAQQKEGVGAPLLLDDRQKQAITREDWQLLSTFVTRLDSLSSEKQKELGAQIAERFIEKLEWNGREQVEADPIVFLQRLYWELRKEWQLGK
ncbi:RDD family protein [Brevibacillus invocatus]|uniref:RDD family protein n=1 Tax=Brevibacillus invocatus TaxID=173959 RepID=A0A3M8CMA7_9BACL|nr:RDD family protein [Brevibacillus invocatus]RNB76427.1 RDD family protein [Brevibacillus invocatus]